MRQTLACSFATRARTFYYDLHREANPLDAGNWSKGTGYTWRYFIYPDSKSSDPCFEASFKQVSITTLRSVMLKRRGDACRGVWLTACLFAHVSTEFEIEKIMGSGFTIQSSIADPARQEKGDDRQTADARNAWCRMMVAGKATYDHETGRFIYKP